MKKFKVGIQLYSLRDAMAKDMDTTLKNVKDMGYDYVEFAGYFGKTAEEVKAMLDKYGLCAISVHQSIDLFEEKGQEAVDFIKTLGAEFSVIPWYEKDNYFSDWEGTMASFKKASKLLGDNGIKLLYHNHDFEFEKIDGEYILDKLYRELDESVIDPELDTCWIRYAGADPVEYIKKYSGRLDILHLKDFICRELGGGPAYALIDKNGNELKNESKEDNGFKMVPLGNGIQNWQAIITKAEEAGIEYLIVEQDESPDRDPLEAAKMSRDYLRSLGI